MAKISPIGRVSYPRVFRPEAYNDQDPKYSIVLIWPKDGTDLSQLKEDISEAIRKKWGDKPPRGLKIPVRDGDVEREGKPEFEGCWFATFSAKADEGHAAPTVVGPDKQPISEASQRFYPGCWARVMYSCYAYDTSGNRGVGLGLQHVQKCHDDEPFVAISSADEFDAVEQKVEGIDDLISSDLPF